ncbi:urease subunit beta [bacterium]|nr:urease subunit beta [bacterium]
MKPGEFIPAKKELILNEGRRTDKVLVKNSGQRPVQIGSHIHFFEVNKVLIFKRRTAFGMRLDIPSGSAVRFEPGEEKEVNLVELGGTKDVYGLNNLTNGHTSSPYCFQDSAEKAKVNGFKEA